MEQIRYNAVKMMMYIVGLTGYKKKKQKTLLLTVPESSEKVAFRVIILDMFGMNSFSEA